MRGMRRDLAAYLAWKQVGVGFLSLASRLVEARRGADGVRGIIAEVASSSS
jgi:hypothetical protein